MANRRARPSLLLPAWRAVGFAVGTGATALLPAEASAKVGAAIGRAVTEQYDANIRTMYEARIEGEESEVGGRGREGGQSFCDPFVLNLWRKLFSGILGPGSSDSVWEVLATVSDPLPRSSMRDPSVWGFLVLDMHPCCPRIVLYETENSTKLRCMQLQNLLRARCYATQHSASNVAVGRVVPKGCPKLMPSVWVRSVACYWF